MAQLSPVEVSHPSAEEGHGQIVNWHWFDASALAVTAGGVQKVEEGWPVTGGRSTTPPDDDSDGGVEAVYLPSSPWG